MTRSPVVLAIAAAFLVSCATKQLALAPATAAPPDWWREHVRFMCADGGAWITPNPQAPEAPGGPDAYGMTWTRASHGRLLTGRLYGLKEGREVAEYWTFNEYYHAGEGRVIVQQWSSWGAYGEGETTSPAPNRCQLDQTFWLADGSSRREGHRTMENGDEYETQIYDIDAEGKWSLRDSNTWRRAQRSADTWSERVR
ncbi:MAG: hypothetical protein H6832_01580 [Planctomycetes bacterium]|nr:hypothetical protein [Planctomycetota bacterium]